MRFSLLLLTMLVFDFGVAHGETTYVVQIASKLANVGIIARVPQRVCGDLANQAAQVSAAALLIQRNILADVTATDISKLGPKRLRTSAQNCPQNCDCQAWAELLDVGDVTGEVAALKEQFEHASEKMIDQDFIRCQKRKKLTCKSPEVVTILKQIKDSSE